MATMTLTERHSPSRRFNLAKGVITKKCVACGTIKPLDSFSPLWHRQYSREPWQRHAQCRSCVVKKQCAKDKAARDAKRGFPVKRINPHALEKICPKCQRLLPISDYWNNSETADGKGSRCKQCVRQDSRATRLRTKYGMTPSDYARMADKQGGLCAICGVKPRKLVVDHSHGTGAVRGLLCGGCNTAIGQMRDSPRILRSAADYLEKHGGA